MLHRAIWSTAVVLLLLLPAGPARASCLSATSCLCNGEATLFDATITSVTAGGTTFSVSATHGAPVDGGTPSLLILEPWPGDAVGQRHLVFGTGGRRTQISSSSRVQCNNLEVPLSEALELALAPDCAAQLVSRGLVEPPCNDTRSGCGSAPGALGGAAALLILWALAFRKKRAHGTT